MKYVKIPIIAGLILEAHFYHRILYVINLNFETPGHNSETLRNILND